MLRQKSFLYKNLFFFFLLSFAVSSINCQEPENYNGQAFGQEEEILRKATTAFHKYPPKGNFKVTDFFNFPYPHLLRLDPDGSLALKNFPALKRKKKCSPPTTTDPLVRSLILGIDPDKYISDIVKVADKQSQGFSTNPSIYFRLTRGLDPKTIPPAVTTRTTQSPIFLVNIDPKSPQKGKRIPLKIHPGLTSRLYEGTLVVIRPYDGFVLQQNTLYAAVILSHTLRDKEGWPLESEPLFTKLAGKEKLTSVEEQALRKSYEPLFDFIRNSKAVKLDQIVAATLFRTGAPLKAQRTLRTQIRKQLPEPKQPKEIKCSENSQTTPYITCTGYFESPLFQNGSAPFLEAGSGVFRTDKKGSFLYTMKKLRFAMTIPKRYLHAGALRERQFPIVMYAHGTGGSYRSFINNKTAKRLAHSGIAGFGIDQAVNGARTASIGSTRLDFLFFNALNLPAARDNVRQSAADYYWQVRFLKALRLKYNGKNFQINPKKLWFMGHSQGGLTGPLFLAFETDVQAAFLSAPGALIVNTLLYKTKPEKPVRLPELVEYMLCDTQKISSFHPLLSIIQNVLDPADPVNYAGLLLSPQRPPLHLLMTEGLTDHYAPKEVFEPLAVAAGLPILGKVYDSFLGLRLRALPHYKLPVQGNVKHPSGKRFTAGFTQHAECRSSRGKICDGHFVSTNNPNAMRNWQSFFQSLVHSEVAQIH